MKVAFIAHPELPGGWYRGIGPMVALHARGHEVRQLWVPGSEALRAGLLTGCDVLHIHRRHDDEVLQLVRHARAQGMAIIYDNDDDLSAVPRGNARYREYGGRAGERALRQIRRLVQGADLVSAPSPVILERFREYGADRVELLENYVPDEVLQTSVPTNGSQVVVGWVAGQEHHADAERIPLRDAVGRALDACPQLVVHTIGLGLGLRHERYRNLDPVPFAELPAKLAQFDVGLAPIGDTPFNRARSNIKVKEYAALGRPWLASPVGPYVDLGEKEGGRLVPDDGWCDAIVRLLDRPRERRKLAKQARKWGRAQAISANAARWERALQAAVECASARGPLAA